MTVTILSCLAFFAFGCVDRSSGDVNSVEIEAVEIEAGEEISLDPLSGSTWFTLVSRSEISNHWVAGVLTADDPHEFIVIVLPDNDAPLTVYEFVSFDLGGVYPYYRNGQLVSYGGDFAVQHCRKVVGASWNDRINLLPGHPPSRKRKVIEPAPGHVR